MAKINTNTVFLSFAGIELQTYYVGEIKSPSNVDEVDVTAGSGRTGRQRMAGLTDRTMDFNVYHDDTTLSVYDAALVVGTIGTLIYGPRGNTAGYPKFEGSMLLTKADGPTPGVEKGFQQWALSFTQADEPTSTIEGGDTF